MPLWNPNPFTESFVFAQRVIVVTVVLWNK